MAHIEKTDYGTYRVRYRDDQNRERSKTFKKQVDAKRFMRTVETDIVRGEYVDPRDQRVVFRSLAEDWWPTTYGLQPSTRHGYRVLLDNHVLTYFGARAQGSIDPALVKRFVADKLREGKSPKRVANMVSIVSLIMKYAIDAGVRRDNPAAGTSVPQRKGKVRRADLLTMAQVRTLVDYIPDEYRPAIWLLVFCGLRPSELCGLKVRSIDFQRYTLTVMGTLQPINKDELGPYRLHEGPPKTNAGERTIPIPKWLVDDIAAMIAARGARSGANDWVFESPVAGRPLNRDWFRAKCVRPSLKEAGLPETFRNYDFRHLHASLLIESGASILEIAHRMGHTDPTVTLKVYGHLLENRQEELTNLIDEAMRNAGRVDGDVIDLNERRRSIGE